MNITRLTVNNRENPSLVDHENIHFSWNIKSEKKQVYQDAYNISVYHRDSLVWCSRWVASNNTLYIPYKGEPLQPETTYNVKVLARCSYFSKSDNIRKGTTLEGFATFGTGIFNQQAWGGVFIGEERDKEYHIYRKNFSCKQQIKQAKVYICGLGHFELYINGNKTTESVLEPGWSDYRKTCFYTAYDITEHVTSGSNAAVVKLGDGMFNIPGADGRYVYYTRSYGKPKFITKIVIEYTDQSKQTITTDETWKKKKSPIAYCCIYGGEEFDGRLWKKDILLPQYTENSDQWSYATAVPFPQRALKVQTCQPLKVMQTYQPVQVSPLAEDTLLYDFGKNFSGFARISLKTDGTQAGQKIVMIPSELIDSNNFPDQRVTGENYSWDYIVNDDEYQEFAPDFTYTGFRYVTVQGVSEKPHKNLPQIINITGEFIYPDVHVDGDFSCSNNLFNDIHAIIKQAILSNTKSYFTDCPHREKLGWLEQTHLIGPSIMYNLDVHVLYHKIQGDMADSQKESGLVPDICPEYVTGFEKWHEGFVDSPEWGSAIIINPWYVYQRYGDMSLCEKYYNHMKKYLAYLTTKTHHHILHHGLGDWLDIGPMAPHSQNTSVPIVATCIYYYDIQIMKNIAELLGKIEDTQTFNKLAAQVYQEYNLQFLDTQTGRYGTGSQAAQALSLMVGLVPAEIEDKVVEQLKQDIMQRNYALTAGDIGYPFVIRALMKYGLDDILYKMLCITDTPGYGYQVVHGATTLTEEWDGPNPENPHGSQNHLMLGSIEEWLFGSLGGINLISSKQKAAEVIIKPYFAKALDWVKTSVRHPYGIVKTYWQRTDDNFAELQVEIPCNVTACIQNAQGELIERVGSGTYSYCIQTTNNKEITL